MSISSMSFTPTGGLNDATYSPTTPVSESAIRGQIQGVSNQLRDFINSLVTTLNSTVLGSSGSENISSASIAGITGNTIYAQIVSLLALEQSDKTYLINLINAMVAGQINTTDTVTGKKYAIIINNGLLGIKEVG